MTDNEFNELSLNKEISEMEDDEARETLVDFMQAHAENREAYDELSTKLDKTDTEFREELEKYEDKLESVKAEYAEEAAEYVNMSSELIQDRFSLDEVKQIIDEAEGSEEFSESEEPEDEDEDRLTTFAQREEKGRREAEDGPTRFRDEAQSALRAKWGAGD